MDEVSAVCRGLVRSVVVMTFKLMVWSLYLIEIMFFTGLIGCAVAVGFSWVSIFKSGFTDKDLTSDKRVLTKAIIRCPVKAPLEA